MGEGGLEIRKEEGKRWKSYLEAMLRGGGKEGAWARAERWPLRDEGWERVAGYRGRVLLIHCAVGYMVY